MNNFALVLDALAELGREILETETAGGDTLAGQPTAGEGEPEKARAEIVPQMPQ